MSLDELAASSGVSRAALSHIETSRGNPTIGVLCRIAEGLEIPLSELIGDAREKVGVRRLSESHVLRSPDGKVESRPLTPVGSHPHVELHEVRLAPHGRHASEPHAPRAKEIVVVLTGRLRLSVGGESFELAAGDSVALETDTPHTYENLGTSETRYHDIIFYWR
jgi:quercetin dioxygenase-like cupin family protein